MKKMRMKFSVKVLPILVLSIMLVGFCVTANAGPITINNPSFEVHDPFSSSGPKGPWNANAVDNWNIVGSRAGMWLPYTPGNPAGPQTFLENVPHGEDIAYSEYGDIWQDVGVNVAADKTYTLSVDVGNRLDRTLPEHYIQIRAGSTVIASGSASSLDGYFSTATAAFDSYAGNQYIGQALSVWLVNAGQTSQVTWDNVRLMNDDWVNSGTPNPVPEPSTLLLLGGGLIGFVGLRRKFKA